MSAQPHRFDVLARDGEARAGKLVTRSGTVSTPAFMTVATFGAVRGVAVSELKEIGAEILLANMPAIKPGVVDKVMNSLLNPRSGLTPKGKILDDGVTKVLELRSRYIPDTDLTDTSRYIDLSYYNQVAGS